MTAQRTPRTVETLVDELRGALFPWHFGATDLSDRGLSRYVGRRLDGALASLEKQVRIGLWFECDHQEDRCEACAHRAAEVTSRFASRLPAVREMLDKDA